MLSIKKITIPSFSQLKESKYFKNILILGSGTAIAQILSILSSPILSRIYTTTEFGILASVVAASGVIISISTLRYESAIVLENDDKKVNVLQRLCVSILLLFTVTTLFFVYVYPKAFFWVKDEGSDYLIYAVPLVFATSLFTILFFRLNREEQYKILSISQIVKRVGIVVVQLALGLLGVTTIGLILGNIVGLVIAILVILLMTRQEIYFPKIGFSLEMLKKHYRFPLFSAPQTLVSNTMNLLPIMVIGANYGTAAVGIYFMAAKIVALPSTFIGQTIRSVFYKESVKRKDQEANLLNLYRKTTIGLLGAILIPAIILIIFGPSLFSFVFGSEWAQSGELASWLILWHGANFILVPTSCLFLVYDKQKIAFWIYSSLGIVRVLVLIITPMHFGIVEVIALYSIVSGLCFISVIIGWHIYMKKLSIRKANLLGH